MSNKVAVVTGGASGIGLATCKLLAKNNYDVVISDVNDEAGKKAVEEIKKLGVAAIYQHADVSKYEQVEALINKTVSQFGKLDVLVNNAGIGPKKYQKTADYPLEEFDKIVAVNQNGVFYGMKLGIRQMLKQGGGGSIVNVSSIAGVYATNSGMGYTASKFAVVGMTKSAALEYGKHNIRINCICPYATDTPILEDSGMLETELRAKISKTIPLRRYAEPTEMAEGILWLATDKSSFVTGHTLILDGGFRA